MYDITSRNTFSNTIGWIDSVSEHGSPHIRVALVGHKTDLDHERSVSTQEGQMVG